ncbi:Fe-S protein, homolog of lactate dehydrogenase SO1521 [hydrothermal vent metagenome]|uniref:Fe-S protein, homolog of lactate dehydrogenase SO1521 n=1 Tax=hydrothermal vent metagenome TaxID=652676 RepID=A0A3B0XTD7_9ZZZZ
MAGTFLQQLATLLDADALLTDPAECRTYGYDNSTLQGQPLAVALPDNHQQVVDIVNSCRHHKIALIARGQGTGTTGATVPGAQPTLIVSLQRMNRIIEVDHDNRLMVVQPGVTNQAVQDAAAVQGFFWPPDPTSAAVCTIGGNLAYNSAGPRAVKYGTPRDNTLALTAVTGQGETLHTGTRTTKGVVGYDLTRLLIGSEGTLAIITEAILKLTPLQPAKRTLRLYYDSMHSAAQAVSAIMAQPVVPCALEFMDGNALKIVRSELGDNLPASAGALLMVEIDALPEQLDALADRLTNAARVDGLLEVTAARTKAETDALWAVRKALSPALRRVAPKKINEDVVVPVSRIPELVAKLQQLADKHQTRIVNFGHAGNGNLHVNLLYDPADNGQLQRVQACLEDVFSSVLSMQGTISGEHGIGLVKRDWVGHELDAVSLQLMHAIKAQFDPDGILNPGKTLPNRNDSASSSQNIS